MYRAERSEYRLRTGKGVVNRGLYVNEKEVPALVKSIEGFIAVNPQSVEAQELLDRILICIEKQCHSKANS